MIFHRRKDKDKEEEKLEKTDIGLRLLKELLLRLYSMLSANPLKWYEILISVIMGVLLGLGIGSVLTSYLKIYLQVQLIHR
jgi:hypothetical protein